MKGVFIFLYICKRIYVRFLKGFIKTSIIGGVLLLPLHYIYYIHSLKLYDFNNFSVFQGLQGAAGNAGEKGLMVNTLISNTCDKDSDLKAASFLYQPLPLSCRYYLTALGELK